MGRREKTVLVLLAAALLCVAAVGVVCLTFLSPKEPLPQEEKQDPNQIRDQSSGSANGPPPIEQGSPTIKEELGLAERLIRDFPGNENPLIIKGDILRSHGDAVEARKCYEEALKINPMRPDVHIAISEFCIREAKFEEAITHWREVLAMQPQAQLMHGYIGEAFFMLNKPVEAIEELQKEIQVTPYSSRSYSLIGQSYLQLKEYEKAKENYEQAVKINPENADAYYGLMTVCTKLGDKDKAKEYSETFRRVKAEARDELKAAKVVYDDIAETQKRAALTYIKGAQLYRISGKPDKAEELLKRAMQLNPEDAECLLELASLYQENGRRTEAVEIHEKVRQMELDSLVCLIDFGNLSVDLQQYGDAERAFDKAIQVAPQSPNGYQKLAALYLTMNKELPKARQLAEKAVELETTALNYSVLSQACVVNRDGAAALQAIKRALDLEPRNREYQRRYDLIRRMN